MPRKGLLVGATPDHGMKMTVWDAHTPDQVQTQSSTGQVDVGSALANYLELFLPCPDPFLSAPLPVGV